MKQIRRRLTYCCQCLTPIYYYPATSMGKDDHWCADCQKVEYRETMTEQEYATLKAEQTGKFHKASK